LILMVLLFARASKQDLDVIVLAALFKSWQKLKILPLAWSKKRVPQVYP
jgi:hypothetical protein